MTKALSKQIRKRVAAKEFPGAGIGLLPGHMSRKQKDLLLEEPCFLPQFQQFVLARLYGAIQRTVRTVNNSDRITWNALHWL